MLHGDYTYLINSYSSHLMSSYIGLSRMTNHALSLTSPRPCFRVHLPRPQQRSPPVAPPLCALALSSWIVCWTVFMVKALKAFYCCRCRKVSSNLKKMPGPWILLLRGRLVRLLGYLWNWKPPTGGMPSFFVLALGGDNFAKFVVETK